jgi:hypothetical protein
MLQSRRSSWTTGVALGVSERTNKYTLAALYLHPQLSSPLDETPPLLGNIEIYVSSDYLLFG